MRRPAQALRTLLGGALVVGAITVGGLLVGWHGPNPASGEQIQLLPGSVDVVTAAPPAPTPPANPCAGNRSTQLVKVSISRQHLWLCQGSRLVADTAVTTGMDSADTHTPVGTFTVQARVRDTVLYPSSGGRYPVAYWIPFDGPDYGFHDASWQRIPYGDARYRTAGSHGCVHLPATAMAALYRWVKVGATVTIST